MNVLKSFNLATLLLLTFAPVALNSGCELVTEFDRGKLLDAAEDSNGFSGDFDTGTQGEDAAAEDADSDAGVDSETGDGDVTDTGVACEETIDCGEPEDPCEQLTCIDGSCVTSNKDRGVFCDLDGGSGVCDGQGSCVPVGCTNDVKDGDETGVDCGGRCDVGCGDGDDCFTYSDCASRFCQGGLDADQDAEVPETPPGKCAACKDDDDCDAIEDESWCNTDEADGTCEEKKEAASECDEDNECLSGSCKADYDEQGAWCAEADECMHEGKTYEDGDESPDCYDSTNRAICDEGSWERDGCGDEPAQDSDDGDEDYTTAGTVTVYAACVDGACGTTQYADSCDNDVLTEYGVDGVSEVATQYDCEQFETTTCEDNEETINEWTCEGNPGRCVDTTDSTVPCGESGCSNSCEDENCTYVERGCVGNACAETDQNPDDGQSYCLGCALDWLAEGTGTGSNCCGDDLGEDFEQVAGAGRSCCYNAAVLASGSSSGSILCYNGELYDCGGAVDDDSGIAEHKTNCDDAVGGIFCTSSNTWGAADDAGCSCGGNGNCTSNHCRMDWDGDGQFCAQDDTSCVYDNGTTVAQRADGWVECNGGDSYRICTSGSWDAGETNCGATTCDTGCGYVTDADNNCVSGQGIGVAGGCEAEDTVGTAPTCNDCGDVVAVAGGCGTSVTDCSDTCGSPECIGDTTNDSGVDVCASGDSYNRIDACALSGFESSTQCRWSDDGAAHDTLNQDCGAYACTGAGVCLLSCTDVGDCAVGYTCSAPTCVP